MNFTFHFAETEEERTQVYRLRYEIYVEEMNIFGDVADHERKELKGPNDAEARLLYAKLGDEIVGSMRLNLGKDAPFSDELEETYNLARFRPTVADDQVLVLTRFMVRRDLRGSSLSFLMIEQVACLALEEDIELAVCDCQPHLIRYYRRMGFRSYGCAVYNDPQFGIMTPLAFVVRDLAYLDAVRSPLRKALEQPVNDEDRVACIAAVLGEAVVKETDELAENEREGLIRLLSDEADSLFSDMLSEDIASTVAQGYVMQLKKGDCLIKKGQQTSTLFVVLSGELEVHNNVERLHTIRAGEVVGELGFLLGSRRSANVCVTSGTAQILSLDDSRMKKIVNAHRKSPARFLLNLYRVLAERIPVRRNQISPSSVLHSLLIAA